MSLKTWNIAYYGCWRSGNFDFWGNFPDNINSIKLRVKTSVCDHSIYYECWRCFRTSQWSEKELQRIADVMYKYHDKMNLSDLSYVELEIYVLAFSHIGFPYPNVVKGLSECIEYNLMDGCIADWEAIRYHAIMEQKLNIHICGTNYLNAWKKQHAETRDTIKVIINEFLIDDLTNIVIKYIGYDK